jgi:hypothetical protein
MSLQAAAAGNSLSGNHYALHLPNTAYAENCTQVNKNVAGVIVLVSKNGTNLISCTWQGRRKNNTGQIYFFRI